MSLWEPIDGDLARRSPIAVCGTAPLLDLDPDLGRLLSTERRDAARRELMVRAVRLRPGRWPALASTSAAAAHLGVLVLDGLLGRELRLGDVTSLELLGGGDLVRPWDEAGDDDLLGGDVEWSALVETRLAILDRHIAGRLAGYPEIYAVLLERTALRSRRLAVNQAISQFNRVDRRVLSLLWHLAERWGKVTPAGVKIPWTLPHWTLAQMVGARRPSVTTALGELARAGEVARGAGRTWVLTGDPVGERDGRTAASAHA